MAGTAIHWFACYFGLSSTPSMVLTASLKINLLLHVRVFSGCGHNFWKCSVAISRQNCTCGRSATTSCGSTTKATIVWSYWILLDKKIHLYFCMTRTSIFFGAHLFPHVLCSLHFGLYFYHPILGCKRFDEWILFFRRKFMNSSNHRIHPQIN